MYHPPGTNDLEQWFELYNPGTKPADISGWRISRGVEFTFPAGASIPAGGYLVIAADGPTFHARYPSVNIYLAGWIGKLGHHLELSDGSGKVINAVEFYGQGDWGTRVMGPIILNRQGWEWYSAADGNGSSLELANPTLPNSFAHNWSSSPVSGGTPGIANSALTNDMPPFVSEVSHWPPVPKSTQAVFVTARIVDEALSTAAVTVHWRVDGSPTFSSTLMLDDGAHQDGIAQDGVYGASIPAHPNHAIIELYITAEDSTGHARKYPDFAPPTNSVRTANLLYQVDDGEGSEAQPTYRIIMTEAERAYFFDLGKGCPDSDSDANMNATWISHDGILSGGITTQVRYNVGIRNRGHGTRTSVPHNYHVNIPEDRLWKGQAGINLNSQYAHIQVIGSAVMRKAGLAMPDSHAAYVRVNSTNLMANGIGNSFGVYAANEQLNDDFIKRSFPLDPHGNAYRGIRDQELCVPTVNGVADLIWHGPNWLVAGYTNAYFKQNNFVQNDWSDLLHLIGVLNLQDGTTVQTYVDDVKKVVNVEEWMRYLAVNTLLDNTETALANGVGDDYTLYRGVTDTRFQVLPYDMDAVMGRGESSVSPRDGVFQMTALLVMDRFVKTSEFAPLYFKALRDLGTTIFASAQMDPLLDHLLAGFVPSDVVETLKSFNASHRDYVLSQIPMSLSVTSALARVSGYLHTTTSSTDLAGQGNAIQTRRVAVNGRDANWVAWQGTWSLTGIPLTPGLNRLHVQAFGTGDAEIEFADVDVWYQNGSGTSAPTTISSDTRWGATEGPYTVGTGLTIASGATLTIDPGATVYLSLGANLTIASGGRLLAEGTESAPIRFTRTPGSTNLWGGITINGGAGTPETRLAHVHLEFNGSTAIHSSGGTLALDHLTFGTTDKQYVSLDNSSFIVSYCLFPTPTAGFEPTHGTGGIKAGGHGIFYRNFFGPPNGYNDVLDFTGGQRGGPNLYFVQNVMSGSGDDGLDLDGTDAWVEGNIFMHIHQNGAPDSSSAISGGDNSGDTSEVTIIGNLIFDCDDAATAKQGNFFTLLNNTIVHTTKEGGLDFASGVVNVRDTTPSLTTFGKGFYLEGNIITDAEQLVRNNDPNQAPVTFNNNILPYAWTGAGTNNYIGDPLLNHIPTVNEARFADWEQAQLMWDWFGPKPGSPARRTGPGGKDKGGVVAIGVYLSGSPTGTNSSDNANILVGINRKGSGIVAPGWPEGAGFTHYKWRLDDGAWSSETAIDDPITLSGLSNGPHSVDVVGKSDAGIYQDDPLLGDAATITSTGVWYVDTNYLGPNLPTIWINEILASTPDGAGGSTPDLVELFNYGTTNVDLSGFHLTRTLSAPFAFTFPSGTKLASGSYMVVAADSDFAAEGIHLGFNLNAESDALYLLEGNAQVIDSIQFGRQIQGYSIGRSADGTWTLCEPTFGFGNIAQGTGEQSSLKINEWLTDREFSAPNSFLELYNPENRPIELSGLEMSDAAGAPNRFVFPALSFIGPDGFTVLVADGSSAPGHLDFKLSSDVGLISLSKGGDLIDLVEYGPQRTDMSEGRSPNGADAITFFDQPTPGAPNPGADTGFVTNVTQTVTNVVAVQSAWKYNQSGTDLGTSWRTTNYSDAAWPSGDALLYHGNGAAKIPIPVGTTLSFRNPEQWTFYFRRHFTYDGPLTNLTLNLTQVIDDGVVVYLNGAEIYRRNMATGPVVYSTPAATTVSDASLFAANGVSADGIVSGDNLVAVEVHQANQGSSDIAMALGVDIVLSETNIINTGSSAPAVVINEVLAKNVTVRNPDGTTADWIELYNPKDTQLDLGNTSLTDDIAVPRKWTFQANTFIETHSRLLIYFDNERQASTNNTGFRLNQDGGTICLFDSPARGGGLLDSVRYGFQVANVSLGRVPDGSGDWQLGSPTPNATNVAATLGSANSLRINEWMANPSSGNDWFELFNTDANPVAVGGLYLTDDLTERAAFRLQPLSFIGTGNEAFVRIEADSAPEQGARHANFNLSAKGEEIGLYDSDGIPIDSVVFGPQAANVSQGRLPDGSGPVTSFPSSASPGESNYLPISGVVINEVLSNTDTEQKIELFNPTANAVDISGWFLSNSSRDLKKFRIPDGTSIAAQGYRVFSESQFSAQNPTSPLHLDPPNGDSVVLSASDSAGVLSGLRTSVEFGPAETNVTFGRYQTSLGPKFIAMSAETFGAANSGPKVGPLVISEIMYLPLSGGVQDENLEFVELENISSASQPMYDLNAPTNTWGLRAAVRFQFPTNVTLATGARVLVVGFDPGNSTLLANFRSHYALSAAAQIFGPWNGHLSDSGETLRLVKPGAATPLNFVPEILVEEIEYSTSAPWPVGRTGDSLQRLNLNAYGDDPVNWKSAAPTPGSPNTGVGSVDFDGDGLPDDWELAHFGNLARDGTGDFDGDGITDTGEFLAGTNPNDPQDTLAIDRADFNGESCVIRFRGVQGRSYRIEVSDNLESPSWQLVQDVPALAATGPVAVSDTNVIGKGTRFYRLRLL